MAWKGNHEEGGDLRPSGNSLHHQETLTQIFLLYLSTWDCNQSVHTPAKLKVKSQSILQPSKASLTPNSELLNSFPAVPAICLISTGVKDRVRVPSYFSKVEKTIRRMLRFNPIPTASLATSTSEPLLVSLNCSACTNQESNQRPALPL